MDNQTYPLWVTFTESGPDYERDGLTSLIGQEIWLRGTFGDQYIKHGTRIVYGEWMDIEPSVTKFVVARDGQPAEHNTPAHWWAI